MDGNNRKYLPNGRKGTQCAREIKDVKKKIHARARKVLWRGIGNFVWASGRGGRKVGGSRKKFSEREGRTERASETPQGTWLGGAQKGSLWLCYAWPLAKNRKVGSLGSGIDRTDFLGAEQLGEKKKKKTRKESWRQSEEESKQI